MITMKTSTLVGIAAALAVVAVFLLSFISIQKQEQILSITNFEECARAGYPIMESYPEQCRTPDGRTFVRDISNDEYEQSGPMLSNGCAVAGCSGQLCVSADEADEIFTTCEFRPEYACYREASCEPQANGKCGWTETPELQQCLMSPPPLDESAELQAI